MLGVWIQINKCLEFIIKLIYCSKNQCNNEYNKRTAIFACEAGPFEKALSPDNSVFPLPLSKFFPTVCVSVNLEKSDAHVIALGKG